MYGLPYPSKKYLPKLLSDNPDNGFNALSAKLDVHFLEMINDRIGLYFLKWPERCPALLLDELGYMVSANLYKGDSNDTKRKKIAVAIQTHKKRSEWTNHAKGLIDAITGYDARIINTRAYIEALPLWVECDGVIDVGTAWATEGEDTSSAYPGLMESSPGGAYSVGIPGMVFIDCHYGINTAVLSADTIAQIALVFKLDVVPAYFKCVLAYIDASGVIQEYAGGTIN